EILEYPELLFTYGDTEELCGKIERCVTDRDYYGKIRRLCSERIKLFDFDWEKQFEDKMTGYPQNAGTTPLGG
ncbi:MAG: glycosyl transferase family 1, partial [Treponema sp.]|nr:glycosyl transferase family 1 [Treponema sp.]